MLGVGGDVSSSVPGPPRPVAGIDLGGVAEALSDASGETSWWYDTATGQVEMDVSESLADEVDEQDDPVERGLVPIDVYGSREAYRDMEVFAGAVADARAANLLSRAL